MTPHLLCTKKQNHAQDFKSYFFFQVVIRLLILTAFSLLINKECRPDELMPKKNFSEYNSQRPISESPLPNTSLNKSKHPTSKFINSTVNKPIPDGIRMSVPSVLGNSRLARDGFVDITAKPFFADPSGKHDSTKLIQRAVNFARDHQMVCFFPSGTYLVSDTINCIQNPYIRSNGKIKGGRHFPCMLYGSRVGGKPKIVLKANSRGFDNPKRPKYLIHFWARSIKNLFKPQPNISINQMLIGIDFEIGDGNPGAVVIRHRAAQGSAVQDCTLNVGDGRTGFEGGIGSGGSLTNITIIGGDIGLHLQGTQPAPTICGITLVDQKKYAILNGSMQALSAVGIKVISQLKGPVIKSTKGKHPANGQICLVDSQIIFKSTADVAISAARSLYINNVYFKNVKTAVLNQDSSTVMANKNAWFHMSEYAHPVIPQKWKGFQYQSPIYLDGKIYRTSVLKKTDNKEPPKDLQSRHLWDDDFPSWESNGIINVKAPPYNARGDSFTDDTVALQKAIDDNQSIFLPKGLYRITSPLKMNKKSNIVGAGRHLSIIFARPQGNNTIDRLHGKPLIETSSIKNSKNSISFCSLSVPKTLYETYALKWQCGYKSILRDVNFQIFALTGFTKKVKAKDRNIPLVLVTGNGAGKWYNFFQESYHSQGMGYRHLMVRQTNGPLSIYQCDLEHARGETNMEINEVKNISIFGVKSEGNQPVITIKNSENIRILGYGGNAAALPESALFIIFNSKNVMLTNIIDLPKLAHQQSSLGKGVDPSLWSIIKEIPLQGMPIYTRPMDRPVLYHRKAVFTENEQTN